MLVYGKNVFKETEVKKIRKVYLLPQNKNSEWISYMEQNHIRYEIISLNRMNHMVTGNHQGIVLDILDYEYGTLPECFSDDFVLVLDHLEDPHNLGAIIRSAEAAGIRHIIVPKVRSVLVNDTVMRVSAGALNRVKIILVSNIHQTLLTLKKQDFMIYATAMDGEDYRSFDYSNKKVLVIGSEGKGISDIVRKSSDAILSIPMKGDINSLNASVAAGIFIFHMMEES